MKNTVNSLQSLYVKFGGKLNDSYEDIADGVAVGNLITIPDMIDALSKLNIGSGGGDSKVITIMIEARYDGADWYTFDSINMSSRDIMNAVTSGHIIQFVLHFNSLRPDDTQEHRLYSVATNFDYNEIESQPGHYLVSVIFNNNIIGRLNIKEDKSVIAD